MKCVETDIVRLNVLCLLDLSQVKEKLLVLVVVVVNLFMPRIITLDNVTFYLAKIVMINIDYFYKTY